MTAEPMSLSYPPLRAPSGNGHYLQQPPANQFSQTWDQNLITWAGHQFTVDDRPIDDLRRAAQDDLIERAQQYTRQYMDLPHLDRAIDRIAIAGHQPELFHPGVWYKNFVLSEFGKVYQANAINLVIDNDLCTSKAIEVPTGTMENPVIERVAFDAPSAALPFEATRLVDKQLWQSFGTRVQSAIQPFVSQPLMELLWPEIQAAVKQGLSPMYALAAGRHRLETLNGVQTLEVPLSQVCQTDAFVAFCTELIGRHEQFAAIYNECLTAYRRMNRIRSHTHPVPELDTRGEWTEMPFWIWHRQSPQRKPLFVCSTSTVIKISDRGDINHQLSPGSLASQLSALNDLGYCLRPRALVTTMYCRLILGQIFLHGIGGAKYDQLTDRIINKFFSVTPPEFITLTATHYLPVELPECEPGDVSRLKTKQRDLVYHPEWFVDTNVATVRRLVDQKRDLIARFPEVKSRRPAWHREMEDVNAQLREFTAPCQRALDKEQRELTQQLEVKRVLGSREFSFCLHPMELVDKLRANVRVH